MRTSPRVIEVTLPGGEVILCRCNAVVQGIVRAAMAKAYASNTGQAAGLVAAAETMKGWSEMVAAGAFTGWRGVLDPNGSPRRFVAGELEELLEDDERDLVIAALVDAALESALKAAAEEAGEPDPTASEPSPTSASG